MNGNGNAAEAAPYGGPDEEEQPATEPARVPVGPPVGHGSLLRTVHSSPTLGKLFCALAKAQGKIRPASKDVENTFYGSKYADLAAVIEAAQPHLSEFGLCVIQIPTQNDQGERILATILGHESGEFIETPLGIRPMRQVKGGGWVDSPDPQAIGSGFSYARRQVYQGAVGVTAETDDDGNRASGRKEGEQSEEAKERALQARPCPACGVVGAIIRGKEEFGGGWLCWKGSKKAAGCGAKFATDPREQSAQTKPTTEPARESPADAAKREEVRTALRSEPAASKPAPAVDPNAAARAKAEAKTLTAHLEVFESKKDIDDCVRALVESADYKAASPETKTECVAIVGRLRKAVSK